MLKRLLHKFNTILEILLKEENTWMWSMVAIFALILTAILLLFLLFAEDIPT